MNGFINLIKPEGMSSSYAVVGVKKKFNIACGHMGTLDPMASGVLPIGVGQASRLFAYTLDKEKTYVAEFKFGLLTDTLDITGKTEKTSSVIPSEEDIKSVLHKFTGKISQLPPKYSAKCVNGKKGYVLARRGVEFTLSPKDVEIFDVKLLEKVSGDTFRFEITCGGGTYIRSLARDIGETLNTFGIMSALKRTKSGVFDIKNGVTFEEFINSENPDRYLIPSDECVQYEKLVLTNERATKILNGVFENHGYSDGLYRVYNEKEFWGIGEAKDGVLRIKTYVR